ncbi:unnamed protein product [Ambrosiozyma monospora]|uniref:Unnamed protein product n=1 Tax=Ambrosiozyma monospora TaxID=43982 RepID=A0ACB5TFB0_AMBMO|nr:unnamed protein product [Ambrosiozyma monospora]
MEETGLAGKYNLAFSASWAAKDLNACIEVLQQTDRLPEASILSLVYGGNGSQVAENVELWKKLLEKEGKDKLAARILSPTDNADKFPGLEAVSESLIDLEEPAKAPAAATEAPVVDAAETPASPEEEKFEEASEGVAEPAKEESPKDA